MKKLLTITLLSIGLITTQAQAEGKKAGMEMSREMMMAMVGQSIQSFKIDDEVSVDDAIDSMKLRANNLNFKMVADLPLSEQVEAMGEKANYMRILAFCDALIAKRMVEYNKIFAGFLPCRIAVIKDSKGQGWIITMNMDMMLNAVDLPEDLQGLAKQVRDTIYSIVDAGQTGDL